MGSTSTTRGTRRVRSPRALLVALAVVVTAFGGLGLPAAGAAPALSAATASYLSAGQVLVAGGTVKSPNGAYRMVMQGDGNLVLYGAKGAAWSSATYGKAANRVAFQTDGNLVLYTAANKAVWSSRTSGAGGTRAAVTNDGHVVITNAAGKVLWSVPVPPSYLATGQTLAAGGMVRSSNGSYRLVMQGDGNLVLYTAANKAVWASGTGGKGANRAAFQTDGNLVLYTAANKAVWASGTSGKGGTRATVRDDGHLTITRSSGAAVWSVPAPPAPPAPPSYLGGGQALGAGQSIRSAGGAYRLVMQGDGNLVVYGPKGATWSSHTNGKGANRAVFQTDGNLVLYTAATKAVWSSGTNGKGGTRATMGNDGYVTITTASGATVWTTKPAPTPASPCPAAAKACVDLTHSVSWLQSGGRVVYGPVPISSGRPGHRTDAGIFLVYWKDKHHLSSIFNNAPMPNSVFFNGGDAFHAGSVYVPSHGCIHLNYGDSEYYFNHLNLGDEVYVFGYAPY